MMQQRGAHLISFQSYLQQQFDQAAYCLWQQIQQQPGSIQDVSDLYASLGWQGFSHVSHKVVSGLDDGGSSFDARVTYQSQYLYLSADMWALRMLWRDRHGIQRRRYIPIR